MNHHRVHLKHLLVCADPVLRYVNGKPRWSNQGDTGYDKFGGGQGKERSVTFFGIAAAMAMQWGS